MSVRGRSTELTGHFQKTTSRSWNHGLPLLVSGWSLLGVGWSAQSHFLNSAKQKRSQRVGHWPGCHVLNALGKNEQGAEIPQEEFRSCFVCCSFSYLTQGLTLWSCDPPASVSCSGIRAEYHHTQFHRRIFIASYSQLMALFALKAYRSQGHWSHRYFHSLSIMATNLGEEGKKLNLSHVA